MGGTGGAGASVSVARPGQAWQDVARYSRTLSERGDDPRIVAKIARELLALAIQMQTQEAKAERFQNNPAALLTYLGNPASKGDRISGDVMAIAYIHAEDNSGRAHCFGTDDFNVRSRAEPGGTTKIILTGTVEHTRVGMYALPDGSIRIAHRDGKPVWAEFK